MHTLTLTLILSLILILTLILLLVSFWRNRQPQIASYANILMNIHKETSLDGRPSKRRFDAAVVRGKTRPGARDPISEFGISFAHASVRGHSTKHAFSAANGRAGRILLLWS